jgi:hypothetical protein
VFQFAAGGDQFVLVLADQAVAGDRLEVADVADGGDVPPGPLDAEEAFQQELVGDFGIAAPDVERLTARISTKKLVESGRVMLI